VPCLVSLLISILTLGAGFAVLRDLGQAAYCVALLQLLFFSYGHVYEFIGDFLGRHIHLIGCYSVAAAGALFLLFRVRNKLDEVTKFLNFMSVSLFFLPALAVGITAMSPTVEKEIAGAAADNSSQEVLKYSRSSPIPDVYYIIFDGYTGAASLQHFFGFDNKEFLGFLKEKGFEVVSDAHSNYVHTIDSLTSTLNMELGNYDSGDARKRMFYNNQVTKNFKALGYKYVHVASGLHAATRFASVDVPFEQGFSKESSV